MVNKSDIESSNNVATKNISEFRALKPPKTVHNSTFHEYRAKYPYFGYVDVTVGDDEFVMFSNNDDFVAQSYFWFGKDGYEPFSVGLFHQLAKVSNFIFDIGSFTGLYSICACKANRRARVTAFEPSRSTWERAKINFAANKIGARVDLRNMALSDKNGTIEFHHYRGALVLQAGASYVKKEGKEIFSTEIASLVVGDDVVTDVGGIDLVKLDVEGAELAVLNGLKKSIDKYKPTFVIEIEPSNFSDVTQFFTSLGYEVKFINEVDYIFLPPDMGRDKVSNFCAVHSSKRNSIPGFNSKND